MKSKIANKIEKETPKELTEKVRTDTNLFLSGVSGSTLAQYEEDHRKAYYCNLCGALNEFDCCCDDENDDIDEEMELLEIAASCKCGAYRIKDNKVYHVADCCCGAG
jgi:hypothetical protein